MALKSLRPDGTGKGFAKDWFWLPELFCGFTAKVTLESAPAPDVEGTGSKMETSVADLA